MATTTTIKVITKAATLAVLAEELMLSPSKFPTMYENFTAI